jgi:hypothetical protein
MRSTCSTAKSPTRRLSLVRSPPQRPRLERKRARVSLAGAPYRPGELPHPLALTLPGIITEDADRRARQRGLPVELVIRARVDAARAASLLALAGLPQETTTRLLDQQADTLGWTLAPTTLVEYALLVRHGEPLSITKTPDGHPVELLLPLELAASWRLDAAAAGDTVERWAANLYSRAPTGALEWEAASAACGLRLAEWAYACALKRSACLSASPHALT